VLRGFGPSVRLTKTDGLPTYESGTSRRFVRENREEALNAFVASSSATDRPFQVIGKILPA